MTDYTHNFIRVRRSSLPPLLTRPYRDERIVAHEPFLMNELVDDRETANELRQAAVHDHDMFMGIAGFRALDLLSVAGCDEGATYRQGLLIDNNQSQIKAMSGVLYLVEHHADPEAFKAAFVDEYLRWVDHVPKRRYSERTEANMNADPAHPLGRLRESEDQYFAVIGRDHIPETREEVLKYFRDASANPNSWLQPENYKRIRDMVLANSLELAHLDLCDTKRFDALKSAWAAQGYTLGHAYLSTALGFTHAGRATDYHGRSIEARDWEKSDARRACENLGKLSDGMSRFLISDVGMGDFGVHDIKRGFKLICTDLREIMWVAFMNYHTASQHISDIFSAGKKTYSLMCHPAGGHPHFDFCKNSLPLLDRQDGLAHFMAHARNGGLSKKEVAAAMKVLNAAPYAAFAAANFGSGMIDSFYIRFPKDGDRQPMLDVLGKLKSAVMQAAREEERGRG